MATEMSEVDGTPPFKKRKSIHDADNTTTSSSSARTWVQTFNRFAPLFGVPAFASPTAPPRPQQKVVISQKPFGNKLVFGGDNVKAPVFTFTPHGGQKLFPSFQNALQGPQLPAKPPFADTPQDVAQTESSVAGSTSEKFRKICAFFSKPAPTPEPSSHTNRPVTTALAAPIVQTLPAAQTHPVVQTLQAAQTLQASQPISAAPSVPRAQHAPLPKLNMIHNSGGLMQFSNIETRQVLTVGRSGSMNVFTPAHMSIVHTATQPFGPSGNAQSARKAAYAPPGVYAGPAATTQPQPAMPLSSRAPASAQVYPSGMLPQSQSAAKRTHAETMSVVPTGPRHGPRVARQIATAVAKLHRLSLDDPVFLEAVEVVQDFTEYRFKSHEHIREALHSPRMPISAGSRISLQGNQRLAMLGDSLLRLAILEEWQGRVEYCRDTEVEGSRLWCNASLYHVGMLHGVDDLLWSLCRGMSMGRRYHGVMVIVATAMEAILGAIWLDCGKNLAVVKHIVRLWFGEDLD